ncbi:MAG: type IX secretion system sortase PorU [Flavobacteriales bacterium]|nr:type IX secretion system sortase PorU [Flavobacteriales bacterium]
MKKIAILLLFFSNVLLFAQKSGTISIEWTENKDISYGDYSVSVPFFNGKNFVYNDFSRELSYVIKFEESGLIDENSLQITNISYQNIEESKLNAIDKDKLPSSINVTIKNSIARDKFYSVLTVSPIIKDGSIYKKVVSFDYSFTRSNSLRNNNQNNITAITNSVLSSGNWYRFYVEKSGAYRITRSFLSELGIRPENVNPKKIKIYGSGGRMAPLNNSDFYPMDLEENAILVVGEDDGVFDNEDSVLFYAEGMDNWSAENETHINLYADRSYYYINVEGEDGKRMQTIIEPTGTSTTTLTTFDDYQFHEVDLTNIGRLGRVWFGESFSIEDEQEFTFNFPNATASTQATVGIRVGGNSFVATKFTPTINGTAFPTLNLSSIGLNSSTIVSIAANNYLVPANQNFTVKLNFDNGGVPTSKGHLDYIYVSTKSNLTGYGKQFRFQYNAAASSSGIVEYQISNASGINQVWDITDIYNVSKKENSNQSNLNLKANLGSLKKYISVDFNDLYTPLKEQQVRVTNQDLKGTIFINSQGGFQDVDYLIIAPSSLNNQAEKLANFHRNYSGLNVKVVNLETIYQEFSSGKQDIGAIRNFIKYVYQNASTPNNRVKFVNLFGDASFDFKNRISGNTNIVPIYHALNSLTSGVSSFASDDFFCYMDAGEGNIVANSPYASDIAVGRMIVSSAQQAEEMVNKIIEYHDLKSYGSWRNNFVTIADDADKAGDGSLQANQNSLTDQIATENPNVNTKKIFLDSYQQETTAGGERYPKAKEDIQNAFEKGALVFNYLGHGGEDGLTGERIWDKFDGLNFFNQYRYPLFITITCDFSRFDNPLRPTAGEYTYWNPIGGAIAMITTTRSIGYAFTFNNDITKNLYTYANQPNKSIAEVLRLSKIDSNNYSDTKVALFIGDPALMLSVPKPQIVLTKVNDVPITQPIDDFQALAFVKLTGEVQDEVGNLLNNYNGELSVNIFDKMFNRTTFNNDNFSPSMTFSNLGETIFRGNASINNGQFEFGFVVPKDIRIPVDNGRISFYSKRNQILLDKTGHNTDIKIGGIDTNAVADTTPPRVRLYMNDESFVNGGITNESPFFLAFLEDEHGINTASGIGHDIVAILDGDESNPYILNDYYETELDDYTKGKIRFPFRNLALGLHTITFKAWDVYNNFISAEIQFVVVSGETITLSNVLNYPNPFVNYTQFWFSHNKPYEPLDVQVQIFTITGKVVKTINQNIATEGFLSREITWDGKDDFGDAIGKGVYVYKLTVKSSITGEKSEKIEKLVIL